MDSRISDLSDSDLKAISEVVAAAQAAQSDAATLLPLHAPGVVIVNIAGLRVLGRDAFSQAMESALSSPLRQVRTEVTIDDVRPANRDTVVVSCTKIVRDEREPGDTRDRLPTVGVLTYVMTRSQTGWEIALAQTTPVAAT